MNMRIVVPVAIVGVLIAIAVFVNPLAAQGTNIQLQPGPFAPNSSGHVVFSVTGGVLAGHIEAQNLPGQGPHAFYVLWFVRTDTGDKAFLGPVIDEQSQSILFSTPANVSMRFSAPAFTTGPDIGTPISLGMQGHNFFVLIAENQIDTFVPHPVSTPPSSFALTATF